MRQWLSRSILTDYLRPTAAASAPSRVSVPTARLDGYLDRLDEIGDGVSNTRVGSQYSDYVYNLRLHIDLVRNRLHRFEKSDRSA